MKPFVMLAAAVLALQVGHAAPEKDSAEEIAARNAFLRANRGKFPLVEMRRADLPFAATHSIFPRKDALEFGGSYYSAFRFRTPDWLDKPVIWMFALKGGSEMQTRGFFDLSILPVDEDRDFELHRWGYEKERFPRFAERFPGFESFLTQIYHKPIPKPGKEHIVWFSFGHRHTEEIRFALTVASERGMHEFGMLPTNYPAGGPEAAFRSVAGAKPRPPRDSITAALELFKTSGVDASLALLEKELGAHTAAGGKFWDFYAALWKEAQTGTGRSDPEWGASAYEWLQQKCLALDAHNCAEELAANTAGLMIATNRYGGATRAMTPFFFALERRQLSPDPFQLEDLGPAFPSLGEIRKREIPLEAKRRISVVDPHGWVGVTRDMPRRFDGSMNNLAELEFLAGDWKRAIERRLWVASWSEAMRGKAYDMENAWYQATSGIAEGFRYLGLHELADQQFEQILNKDWKDPYRNRSKASARHQRISMRIELGKAEESMLAELDALHAEMKKNPYVNQSGWEGVEVTKADCLFSLGRAADADPILAKLAGQGNRSARKEWIRQRLAAGRLDSLENDLLKLLRNYREWGRKIDEAALYSLYADLLEKTGRLNEAIAMRREAIRLRRSFDLFVALPQDLARLSLALARCGDAAGAAAAAAEATRLADKKERVPARVAENVKFLLAAPAAREAATPPPAKRLPVDLQPSRSLVIPVAGMPARGRLTLANPGDQAVEGVLAFDGLPADAAWDGTNATVRLGQVGESRLTVKVDPASFALIHLESVGSAPHGELTVTWTTRGRDDQNSVWTFEAAEDGVAEAVVEAGEFRRNAFYSIPIHHHYQHAGRDQGNVGLRVVASSPARIEMYDAADRAVFVDDNGNGDLGEVRDSLFQDAAGDGHAELPLSGGECMVKMHVFPAGEIPPDGLTIQLEARIGGKWLPVAQDRIVP